MNRIFSFCFDIHDLEIPVGDGGRNCDNKRVTRTEGSHHALSLTALYKPVGRSPLDRSIRLAAMWREWVLDGSQLLDLPPPVTAAWQAHTASLGLRQVSLLSLYKARLLGNS